MPRRLHAFTEGHSHLAQQRAVHVIRPRAFDLHGFVVERHRLEKDASVFCLADEIQQEIRLFFRFRQRDGLGEEVRGHRDARGLRARHVRPEEFVLIQHAFRGTAIARPHERELHARAVDGRPIDLMLVRRHIHAPAGLHRATRRIGEPVPVAQERIPHIRADVGRLSAAGKAQRRAGRRGPQKRERLSARDVRRKRPHASPFAVRGMTNTPMMSTTAEKSAEKPNAS